MLIVSVLCPVQTLDDIHTIDNLAHAHIAQCSAENIMLWCQFIQIFGMHETTAIALAKEYHLKRVRKQQQQRQSAVICSFFRNTLVQWHISYAIRVFLSFKKVKRLSEGFFLRETSRINLLTNEYVSCLPETSIDPSFSRSGVIHSAICTISYGIHSTTHAYHIYPSNVPNSMAYRILYRWLWKKSTRRLKNNRALLSWSWKGVLSNASSSLQTVQNLSKNLVRNSGDYGRGAEKCIGWSSVLLGKYPSALGPAGKVEKSNPNPSAKSPSAPPAKSQKQSKVASPPAVPLMHSSAKGLFSSRQQSPRNTNPVLALSNDPSVRLTSFRKVGEGMTSASSSSTPTTLQSNASLPSGLFPYQSDSNITRSTRIRSNSSGLIKQASRHSLPDVPFQRSNSLSKAESNLINASIVPEFLSTGSEVTNDEVFSSPEQETAVASEFGDSCMKSKVLQASFRGKAGTMDRRRTSTSSRSLSNSSPSNANHDKRPLVNATKYFTNKADDQDTDNATIDRPEACSLDSVLSLTLQLEQTSNANIERRHTISTDDIDPLLLNGLTNDENMLNLMEKADGQAASTANDEEKDKRVFADDRIQHNSAINSQTIE